MTDISLNKTSKNNIGLIVIGVLLLIIFMAGIGILLSSVIISFAEKSRLEGIGATVTLKFTLWFVLIAIATVVAGIMAAVCMSNGRKKSVRSTVETERDTSSEMYNYTKEEKKPFEFNSDYNKNDDMSSNAEAQNHILSENKTNTKTSSDSKLKMTMTKKSDSDIAPVTTSVPEYKPVASDENTNSFFTSGGDL